jgi:hypothetical protein
MKINRVYAKHRTPVRELMKGDVFIDPDSRLEEVWMITDFPSNNDTYMAICLDNGDAMEFDFHHTVWLCNAELNISMK